LGGWGTEKSSRSYIGRLGWNEKERDDNEFVAPCEWNPCQSAYEVFYYLQPTSLRTLSEVGEKSRESPSFAKNHIVFFSPSLLSSLLLLSPSLSIPFHLST
jgi:hypothetical protein